MAAKKQQPRGAGDQPTNEELIEQLGVASGTFAAKLGEISSSAMKSDQAGQMAHLSFLQGVAALPPLVVDQTEDIGFGLGELHRHDQRAAFTGVNLSRLAFETVDMKFSMRVGSHTEAMSSTGATGKSETTISGGGGFLWAKFNAKQTISAEIRHDSKQTRDTNMSASVDIDAHMAREKPAEGIAMMADAANEFSTRVNDLRMKIATAKVDQMIKQLDDGEIDGAKLSEQGGDAVPAAS